MTIRVAGAICAAFLVTAPLATAQTSSNKVAEQTDWSVFVESDPQECWGVSSPKSTENTRDGRRVQVRRGDILLFVTFRPGDEVRGEVSFTGGYPFAEGSTVEVRIGDDAYQLFTDGEWAWPASRDDDERIVASMKRGVDAVLTARSSRGTQTQDTFSLLGFTAAMEEAEARCSS
ncbi:invasion associated locus B family protein [Roseitranquillus sediminis]|uniref:invasion associated locus B family protein n=1 Tax=Roseitranquillus sediminis TaxID=2809051 RepID=UPI001D0C8EBE|nr:invasion associated locus B family protein [Roseitranquillus sediminis]MBM9593475.1 hypothetical protein [Roseitranquillus sediminis]